MNGDVKFWWQSRGIWGTLIAALGGIVTMITGGHGLSPTDQDFLSTQAWNMVNAVSGIVTVVGAVIGWWGRWKATVVISNKATP